MFTAADARQAQQNANSPLIVEIENAIAQKAQSFETFIDFNTF
jgi:hypothetical protein